MAPPEKINVADFLVGPEAAESFKAAVEKAMGPRGYRRPVAIVVGGTIIGYLNPPDFDPSEWLPQDGE